MMKYQFKGLLAYLTMAVLSAVFVLLHYVKLSTFAGDSLSYFSLASVVMPLSGLLGMGFVGFTIVARLAMGVLLSGTPLSATVYYVPTFCASAYWTAKSKLFSVVVPLVCMFFFLLHPVGSQAWLYSCYALVPVCLSFFPRKFPFTHALTSTFIAHSVGSVMWVYLNPAVTAESLLALIPIVAVERFLFAVGMTAVYYAVHYVKDHVLSTFLVFDCQEDRVL